MQRGTSKKRKQQAEQTRKLILDSARKLILEKGIQAFTTQNLVKYAGVSRGAIFHHFPHLEDILLELLEKETEKDIQLLGLENSPSISDILDQVESQYFSKRLSEEKHSLLMLQISSQILSNERIRQIVKNRYSKVFEEIARRLNPEQVQQTEALLRLGDALIFGLMAHQVIFQEEADIEDTWRLFRKMVDVYLGLQNNPE